MTKELEELIFEVDPWFSLSELRLAPDGRKVLIPHARGIKPEATKVESKECAFCPENRHKLKKPYFLSDLITEMVQRGLYVLENKFPTVSPPEISDERARFYHSIGISTYDKTIARGRHLVVIETPNHNLNPFANCDAAKQYYDNLVWAYIWALKTLKAEGHQWGGLGKNRSGVNKDGSKADAGDSQSHHHSQVVGVSTLLLPPWIEDVLSDYRGGIAVPRWIEYVSEHPKPMGIRIIPNWLEYLVRNAKARDIKFQKDYRGGIMMEGCPTCIEARGNEINPQLRISADDFHVSFVDPAPDNLGYRISIVPKAHNGMFDDMSERQVASFASILHQTMVWMDSRFGNCGYNYELRQGPWMISNHPRLNDYYRQIFHWKFDVYPASSELGTLRTQGFMPHLLGIPILKEAPENIALRVKQQ